MASKLVDVTIPEELTPFLYTIKDGATLNDKAKLSIVIGLFLSKSVTLEKAAELAGKTIWEFMEILKSQDIPWGEHTEASLRMDDMALSKLTREHYG